MDNRPKVKTMSPRLAALLFLVMGVFVLVGGYVIIKNSQIPRSYVITHGKIIRSSPARSGNYDILIGFTAKDNKQYSFTSEIPSQIALHSINYVEGASNVKVAYNPQDPGAAPKNASDKSTPVFGTLFEILGGVFAVIGLISTIQQLFTRR